MLPEPRVCVELMVWQGEEEKKEEDGDTGSKPLLLLHSITRSSMLKSVVKEDMLV